MSDTAAPPSDANKSVFYVHITREIDAPIEKVWDALTDLPKYHEWNPFVREMIITDSKKRREGEQEQILTVDKYLLMSCRIPPFTKKVFERITTVDRENHRLSWRNIDYPSWALRAERWQVLSTVRSTEADTGEKSKTRYETWEAFDGVLAYFVKWFIGRKLKQAFGVFVDGLQTRCEG